MALVALEGVGTYAHLDATQPIDVYRLPRGSRGQWNADCGFAIDSCVRSPSITPFALDASREMARALSAETISARSMGVCQADLNKASGYMQGLRAFAEYFLNPAKGSG